MKQFPIIQFPFLAFVAASLLTSCEEAAPVLPSTIPNLQKVEVVGNGSLVFGLKCTTTNASAVSECGFYVSEKASMQDAAKFPSKMTGSTFSAEVTLQGYSRSYYVCAYISNGRYEICSEMELINVKPLASYVKFEPPIMQNFDEASGMADFSMMCFIADGVNLSSLELSYGELQNPSSTLKLQVPNDGKISFQLPDMSIGKVVDVRIFCREGDWSFERQDMKAYCAYPPSVETSIVSDVKKTVASCVVNVLSNGGAPVTRSGVVWSTSRNPTIDLSSKTVETNGTGSFTSTISGLKPGTEYYVRAYATNLVGTSYGQELAFTSRGGNCLESSNCFIVSSSGEFSFKTFKGNSQISVGDVFSAEVLWESYGSSSSISTGSLIPSVEYSEGYVTFQAKSTHGNAVIAVKNTSGTILWSWHIWLTDEPQEQVYYNKAGIMMDRNLGATSATPGDVGALGLLYQWGRKDPFLGSSSTSSSVVAESTISWPSPVASTSTTGTIDYTISHPTVFITKNDYNRDWYYSNSVSTDYTRWGDNKTIYDPCPAGWKVPNGSDSGVWVTALGSSADFDWNYSNYGMNFSNKFGSAQTIWYPFAGNRSVSNGSLYDVGKDGYCWGNNIIKGTSNYYGGSLFCFYNYTEEGRDKLVSPRGWLFWCSGGIAVRCLKE